MLFQVLILLTDFMIFICQLFNKSFDTEIESSHIFLICDSLAFSFVRRQYSVKKLLKNKEYYGSHFQSWTTQPKATWEFSQKETLQCRELNRKRYLEDITYMVSRGYQFPLRECSKYLSRVSEANGCRTDIYFQHKKIKFVSTSGHVMFCLIYFST